jgi:hypothetical protein
MSEVAGQPFLGHRSVVDGAITGDFLMATEAKLRFTVLVVIKRAEAELVEKDKYRNDAYRVGPDVHGGVVQLQSQCEHWGAEARSDANRDLLESDSIYTCIPKGILVAGNLSQLTGRGATVDRSRRSSFERFRQNLHNPEIITYDELLARARLMVQAE